MEHELTIDDIFDTEIPLKYKQCIDATDVIHVKQLAKSNDEISDLYYFEQSLMKRFPKYKELDNPEKLYYLSQYVSQYKIPQRQTTNKINLTYQHSRQAQSKVDCPTLVKISGGKNKNRKPRKTRKTRTAGTMRTKRKTTTKRKVKKRNKKLLSKKLLRKNN